MQVLCVIITCLVSCLWAENPHFADSQEVAANRSLSTYQLHVPGSQPITIYEDPDFNIDSDYEPNSEQQFTQRDPKYQITKRVSTAEYNRPDEDTHTINMKPFPLTVQAPSEPTIHPQIPSLLEQFLQRYGKDPEKFSDNEKDQMSQNLETYFDDMERKNKRPPPHKPNNGWVSLDPVPTYSSAKIYKWNSNVQKFKPNRPSYSQNEWADDDADNYNNRPSYSDSTYSESSFNDDRPYQVPPKPFSSHYPNQPKPSYKPYNDFPSHSSYNDYDDERYFSQKKPWNDLIIDNRPSNFPAEKNHGQGFAYAHTGFKKDKKEHPETYPTSGNGRWVLVSTTKGHQSNRNQKSLADNDKSATTQPKTTNSTRPQKKRYRALTEPSSVSTVLHVMPGGDTKNITTHNGEVIEVARHSRAGQLFGTRKNTTTRLMKRRVQLVPAQDNSGPVLAAVGAGLIPATLSLVAPMVLGKRRRREVNSSVESQIQREPPISVTRSYK